MFWLKSFIMWKLRAKKNKNKNNVDNKYIFII